MTPTWVHFDRRYGKPACAKTTAGYPTVRRGSRSTYVLVLQDGLNYLGYYTGGVDGVFGEQTENAVRRFQQNTGLSPDAVAGRRTWARLTDLVLGSRDLH